MTLMSASGPLDLRGITFIPRLTDLKKSSSAERLPSLLKKHILCIAWEKRLKWVSLTSMPKSQGPWASQLPKGVFRSGLMLPTLLVPVLSSRELKKNQKVMMLKAKIVKAKILSQWRIHPLLLGAQMLLFLRVPEMQYLSIVLLSGSGIL